MQALGFDYDYTIANYNDEIQPLIYSLTVKYLVDNHGYPKEVSHLEYDPNVRPNWPQFFARHKFVAPPRIFESLTANIFLDAP